MLQSTRLLAASVSLLAVSVVVLQLQRPLDAGDLPAHRLTEYRVNLNTADAAELRLLPGLGPELARRVVEHRERAGPFRSLDELQAVRGIGPTTLRRVAPWSRCR